LTADVNIIDSILFTDTDVEPPQINPLTCDEHPEVYAIGAVKSPKSVAFPVVADVM
jgi:hypothetical protein